VLCVGQVEGQEAFTYEVKVMRGHGETSQLAFSDKYNMSEMEREDTVAKLPRPNSLCVTAPTTTLKYCRANFMRKQLCIQRNSVILWTLN
jgi:hypothetical protein